MKKIYLLAVAATLVFFACSKDKDDDTTPEIPENGASALYVKALGKWTFGDLVLQDRKAAIPKTRKGFAFAREAGDDNVGFIEFLSDSTYLLTDTQGHFFTGKFSAKDSTTISLGTYATLSGITFAQSGINFRLTYIASNQSISITAVKAAAIPASDSTALLCRNWYLTRNESGDNFYSNERSDTAGVDSLCVQMTASGTYMVQGFHNKVLVEADVMNWRWHSSKRNYFVYWYPEEIVLNEDDNSVLVRELNKNVFKAFEKDDLNNDGKIDAEEGWKWEFRPAGK